jgi:hypothetical protein
LLLSEVYLVIPSASSEVVDFYIEERQRSGKHTNHAVTPL